MPISTYLRELRDQVGHRLLLCPGVAAVIRDPDGRVLLQLRAEDGTWGYPAGAIDPGETPAQAVMREVWEETGLRVRPERVLGVFGGIELMRRRYPNGDLCEYTATVFACTVVGGELAPQDSETAELRYFALDELPPLATRYPLELLTEPDAPARFQWDDAWLEA